MEFLNGLFLVGAATAIVPIVIHLVQRRRRQQVVFGSLSLLRKTPHHVVRRRRFEELLLVLLRAIALAVLAMAFARPFFRGPVERRAGGRALTGEQALLVLVDNSYSMRTAGRLERAKAEALTCLREAGPATKVGVAAMSARLEELCPIGSTLADAERAVESIAPSWRGTRLDLALRQADRLLTRADRNEAYRRIVLIGDFQVSSWPRRSDWTLSAGIELSCRNVAEEPGQPPRPPAASKGNVFIERVAVPRLVVAGGFVEVISANIRNLTDRPLTGARVAFRIDGRERATRTVNVRPGRSAAVGFRHTFAEPGDVTGSIEVRADDGLPADNVAHFCVHVTPRVHVLLVNADRGERMVLNDGLFLRTALVPAVEGVVSPFEVREIDPCEMKPADLDGVDVALFLNVSTLPAAMTQVPPASRGRPDAAFGSPLGEFLARGGGIGLVCGKRIVADQFNRTFAGLAPCKLLRPAMAEGETPVVINQTDLRHEIFSAFARPHSGDVSLAEFSQYFLVTDSLAARVPARFSSRDAHPALLERVFAAAPPATSRPAPGADAAPAGRPMGKSVLFVSSMDLEWNNLCLKSVFVPFVHQLTKRLCARRTGSVRNFVVGDDVAHDVPAGAASAKLGRRRDDAEPQGKPPAGRSVQWDELAELKVQSIGARHVVSFRPDRPGIYELIYAGGNVRQGSGARFAVNLDPKEPDLRPLETRLLLSTVRTHPALEGAAPAATGAVAAKATLRQRMESRQKVWRYFMFAALLVLVAEMLLAGRIGRA